MSTKRYDGKRSAASRARTLERRTVRRVKQMGADFDVDALRNEMRRAG